eukprot:scaffold2267_cov187-Ochromonas_danica.AAC.11
MGGVDEDSVQFYFTFVAIFLCGILASGGGIGGGGVHVPLLLVLGGFSYHQATVLSLTAVLGNYIAQGFINWSRHHPTRRSRPLINWDLVLLLLPAQLGGSNIGVLVAKVAPDTILLIFSTIVMVFAVYKTWNKAIFYWKQEEVEKEARGKETITTLYLGREEEQEEEEEGGEEDDEVQATTMTTWLLPNHHHHQQQQQQGGGGGVRGEDLSLQADDCVIAITSKEVEEGREGGDATTTGIELQRPWSSISILMTIWLLYVSVFIILQLAFTSCSTGYYILLASIYPPLLFIIYFSLNFVTKHQRDDPTHWLLAGDIDFSNQPYFMPVAAFLIGICSTLLGIGGGELMGPFLLSCHILPVVSTATTSTMSLLNTGNNVVHYAILGKYPFLPPYGLGHGHMGYGLEPP